METRRARGTGMVRRIPKTLAFEGWATASDGPARCPMARLPVRKLLRHRCMDLLRGSPASRVHARVAASESPRRMVPGRISGPEHFNIVPEHLYIEETHLD